MPVKYWFTAIAVTWVLGSIDGYIRKEKGVKEYKGRNWIMGPSVITMIFGLVGFFMWIWGQP